MARHCCWRRRDLLRLWTWTNGGGCEGDPNTELIIRMVSMAQRREGVLDVRFEYANSLPVLYDVYRDLSQLSPCILTRRLGTRAVQLCVYCMTRKDPDIATMLTAIQEIHNIS